MQAQLQGGDVTLKNLSTHLQSPVKGLSTTQDACLVIDNQRLAAIPFDHSLYSRQWLQVAAEPE